MRLAFKVQGDGVPLIIVHGFLGSSDNWRTMSKLLSEHFRVFTVDLRNHGQSPHSAVMNYQIMAEDLREFIEEHGLRSPHVLGHSMGGKVAMQFTMEYSAQVSKLIVVDIAPKAYPSSQRSLLQALHDLELANFRSFSEIDAALAPSIRNQVLRQFLLKNLARDPVMGFRWKIDLDALIKNYEELTKNIVVREPSDKPSLFIRGRQSKYIQDEDLPVIKQFFPQAEISTIPKAGHWVHADAPAEFLEIVSDFLA